MPSDIPPCPVCGGKMHRCPDGYLYCFALERCGYRNTVEAHVAIYALVERGRCIEDATRHLDLARRR